MADKETEAPVVGPGDLIPGMPVFERTVVDPETGEEIYFSGNSDGELEGIIADYFDPYYDNETGKFHDWH